MNVTRRRLFLGTTAIVSVVAIGACVQQTAGNLQDGITQAGNVINALYVAYGDMQRDAPTLVPKGSPTDLQIVQSFTSAKATLAAMDATQPKLALGISFRAIESDINTVANLVGAALPVVGAVVPAVQPFVVAFQSGNLIFQSVIEPLVAQLFPPGSVAGAPLAAVNARFAPPAGMTLEDAKRNVLPLAARALR